MLVYDLVCRSVCLYPLDLRTVGWKSRFVGLSPQDVTGGQAVTDDLSPQSE